VLCFVVFCCVLLCFVVFCCVVLCCVVLCCVVLCCVVLCCVCASEILKPEKRPLRKYIRCRFKGFAGRHLTHSTTLYLAVRGKIANPTRRRRDKYFNGLDNGELSARAPATIRGNTQ